MDDALEEIDAILPDLIEVVGDLATSVSSIAQALDEEKRNSNGKSHT